MILLPLARSVRGPAWEVARQLGIVRGPVVGTPSVDFMGVPMRRGAGCHCRAELPEFLGEAFTAWAKANGVAIQYIQPGKPNQNAFIERFNGTLREEVLDQHLFARLEDVREAVHWWMIDYNETRPHDALGGLTPAEYRTKHTESSTFEVSA